MVIQFVYDIGFRNIVVESDYLNVVNALNSSIDDNSYFGLVINDDKSLSCLLSSFLISHVRRVDNIVAHSLANCALVSVDCV